MTDTPSTKTIKKPTKSRRKGDLLRKGRALGKEVAAIISDYAIGDVVTHPQFGDGTVTAVDGVKLSIEFSDGRTRVIVDDYVKRR
jgi:DNA helicase II / ATP-dependent DNA helicase PcrA